MGYPAGYPIPKVPWDGIGMGSRGGPYHLNGMIWDCARTKWQTKPDMASAYPKQLAHYLFRLSACLLIDTIPLPLGIGSGSLIPYHPIVWERTPISHTIPYLSISALSHCAFAGDLGNCVDCPPGAGFVHRPLLSAKLRSYMYDMHSFLSMDGPLTTSSNREGLRDVRLSVRRILRHLVMRIWHFLFEYERRSRFPKALQQTPLFGLNLSRLVIPIPELIIQYLP